MKLQENPTSVSRSDTCGRTDMTVLNPLALEMDI